MEQELQQQQPEQAKAAEHGDNSVSVVTDLPAASFIVDGPAEYRGSGTYWVRKGAPPGSYTATFNPVAGFATPPAQTKDAGREGADRLRRQVPAQHGGRCRQQRARRPVTIFRPDGRPIDLSRPGRALLDDLPPGTYTAVFKDLPGCITPSPVSQALTAGGRLSFYGEYRDAPAAQGARRRGGGRCGVGRRAGQVRLRPRFGRRRRRRHGQRRQDSGQDRSRRGREGLDRRVQMVVTSYPPTAIEEDYDPIPYPEVIIRKGNFQQGLCQVYLVLKIDDGGNVAKVSVAAAAARGARAVRDAHRRRGKGRPLLGL